MSRRTLIVGAQVVTGAAGEMSLSPQDLIIEGGLIRNIVASGSVAPTGDDDLITAHGRLVFPGLVNAHTHSYGNLGSGMFDGLTLEAWVPFSSAITAGRNFEEGYVSAMIGGIAALRTGTTTVLDHLGGTLESIEGALQAYVELGIRVTLAPMVADMPAHRTVTPVPSFEPMLLKRLDARETPDLATLAELQHTLVRSWHGRDSRVKIALGPSGPQRCSDELLAWSARAAEEFDTIVHTHLLESRAQCSSPLAGERGLVSRLGDHGLLTERLSAAHGVWCSEDELRLIADAGASMVHNPWSNLTLGNGVASFPRWIQLGIRSGIGTDGANCGNDQNMLLAMRLATVIHRSAAEVVESWPTPHRILEAATAGSAAAAGWSGSVGRIEVGRAADLTIIDGTSSTYLPASDPVTQYVLAEQGRDVETVIVGGRVVMTQGVPTLVDERSIVARAAEAQERMLARSAPAIRLAEEQRISMLRVSRNAHDRAPVSDGQCA
ncbi:MAG: hypothetical protein JWL94_442 [Microbacteriaceae bacterium]|nr:hypothetical protein [Microbacteriaceae bacterium]